MRFIAVGLLAVSVACGGSTGNRRRVAAQPPATSSPAAPATARRAPRDLAVLRQVLATIRDNYVDPARVVPSKMLAGALDRLQGAVAEVMTDPSPGGGEVVVRVHDRSHAFSTAVDSLDDLFDRLDAINRFVDPLVDPRSDAAAIEYALVHGVLGTLDPHSYLLEPKDAGEMASSIAGKFGGTGMVIDVEPDPSGTSTVVVRSLIPGGWPAERAGITPGDRILRIDDQSTDSLTVEQAMGRLRGIAGTEVVLVVGRDGVAGTRTLPITRAIIDVSSVEASLLGKQVGYIKIAQFASNVSGQVRHAMDDLAKRGARAWVLDLRGNPGGLLAEAVMTADLFVDGGTIVTTVGRQCVAGTCADKMRDDKRAVRDPRDDKRPLAMLVDSSTASAAEILAGALVNLDRAVAIGSPTFGKGSVQVLFDHDDGSKLRLTIAHYLSANDVAIQAVGVAPDIALRPIVVPDKIEKPADALRVTPRDFREIDLDDHFAASAPVTAPSAPTIDHVAPRPPPATTTKPIDHEVDFAVRLARDVAAAATTTDRQTIVRATRSLVSRHRDREQAALVRALRKHRIAWDAGPATAARPLLSAAIAAITAPLDAGSVATITGTVKNTGTSPAHQVRVRTTTEDGIFDGVELVFGRIVAGASATASVRVEIPERAESGVYHLDWRIATRHGDVASAVAPSIVTIDGAARPQFEFSYHVIDEGDGDGVVQPGNPLRLRVVVKNTGAGRAPRPVAVVTSTAGDRVVVDRGRIELGPLEAGETRDVDFALGVKRDLGDADRLAVELAIYDASLDGRATRTIALPLGVATRIDRSSGQLRIGAADAAVYAAPVAGGEVVATVDAGAVVHTTGTTAGWHRVELEPGRPGFVRAADATPTSDGVDAAIHDLTWQVTPPTVTVAGPATPATTTGDNVPIRASIADDAAVADAYVTVSNRAAKIDTRKVFYASNRGAATPDVLDFATRVPLWPGINTIAIVARDDAHTPAVRTFRVYRSPTP